MQTFLPYPDFVASVRSLDSPRLGKQRVETLQILRALQFPEYGWANHPAVRMWSHRVPALVFYGLASAQEWIDRGNADTTFGSIAEFAPEVVGLSQQELADRDLLPSWVGSHELHESHRSKLLGKDPAYYAHFADGTRPGLEYFWPDGDDAGEAVAQAEGERLWVVRVDSPAALGVCVSGGLIGLTAESGIDSDVGSASLDELREMVPPRRRRTKALLALSRLTGDIDDGDTVGLLIGENQTLLTGTVTGDYRFDRKALAGLVHQRPVVWTGVLPRLAVDPPAALQDVRPIFGVQLRASRVGVAAS